jgi:hypothetical protein
VARTGLKLDSTRGETSESEDIRVLCKRCKVLMSRPRGRMLPRWRGARAMSSLDPLLCERCRALLIPEDSVEAMLAKLSQLSRFGLGADDRPLLAPAPQEE